jgi:hypothetical protein
MLGGGGKDTFDFRSASDSGLTAAKRDTITDFSRQDVIDLARIDADTTRSGTKISASSAMTPSPEWQASCITARSSQAGRSSLFWRRIGTAMALPISRLPLLGTSTSPAPTCSATSDINSSIYLLQAVSCSKWTDPVLVQGANPWQSEIPISSPPLGSGDHLKRLPLGANPAPVAHQVHGPEQIPLNQRRVEASDALLRTDPVQDKVVLNRGSEVVRHRTALPS